MPHRLGDSVTRDFSVPGGGQEPTESTIDQDFTVAAVALVTTAILILYASSITKKEGI